MENRTTVLFEEIKQIHDKARKRHLEDMSVEVLSKEKVVNLAAVMAGLYHTQEVIKSLEASVALLEHYGEKGFKNV